MFIACKKGKSSCGVKYCRSRRVHWAQSHKRQFVGHGMWGKYLNLKDAGVI